MFHVSSVNKEIIDLTSSSFLDFQTSLSIVYTKYIMVCSTFGKVTAATIELPVKNQLYSLEVVTKLVS